MKRTNSSTNIPLRLREDDLPVIADALGVNYYDAGRLRAPCPFHNGDGPHMQLYTFDDGVLWAKCYSHGCHSDKILDAISEAIGDERGNGGPPRERREPRALPTGEELAEWIVDMRRGQEDLLPGLLGGPIALLCNAGWQDRHEALAALGVGFTGVSFVIPVHDHAGELVNIVGYRPGAPNGQKIRVLRDRPRGLVPAPESIEGPTVYVFEGEPDGITATLAGLPATSIPGVEGWKSEYVERFKRFERVMISLDCDDDAREAAEMIRAELREAGIDAHVIDIDPKRNLGYDFKDLVRELSHDYHGEHDGFARAAERVRKLSEVNTAELLAEIVAYLCDYIIFANKWQAPALALAALHTHALDAAEVSPYVAITSPERRCGKTSLRDALGWVMARSWTIDAAPTEATLFRKIAAAEPTILLDEVDALFKSSGERTEPLRAIFNSGNVRGATIPRCVGDKYETVKDFSIFCPKVFTGINSSRWPDTVRDRAIEIVLRRKRRNESVKRFRRRVVKPIAEQIRQRCELWATPERIVELTEAWPSLPDELDDRAADSWEPLLAIADEAGGEWPELAREAAAVLSGGSSDFATDSPGVRLLSDIAGVFKHGDRFATADLLALLCEVEDAPWGDDPPLSASRLADLLRPFGIRPHSVRFDDGKTAKGYTREQCRDAFARYLGGEHAFKRPRPGS